MGLKEVTWATPLQHGYPRPQLLLTCGTGCHCFEGTRRGFPSCHNSSGNEETQEKEGKKEDCILLHAATVSPEAATLVPSSRAAALSTLNQPFCHTMVTSAVRLSNPPQPPLPAKEQVPLSALNPPRTSVPAGAWGTQGKPLTPQIPKRNSGEKTSQLHQTQEPSSFSLSSS